MGNLEELTVPVSGLPWIFLLLFAVSGVVASLIRRKKHQPTRLLLIATGICLILSVAFYVGEKKWDSSSNSILVIAPYRHAGTWVFDDPSVGLQAEPFVSGIPELIDKLIADAGISNAHDGFRLIFSAQPFPGYQTKVVWRRREAGGNWYYSEKYDQEGWLCPALFKYFRRAPKDIYVKAEQATIPRVSEDQLNPSLSGAFSSHHRRSSLRQRARPEA